MAYTPITGAWLQLHSAVNTLADGYYLKFYEANTTTPLNMATDSTGVTLLAQCKLNPNGMPISNPLDNTTTFIPHMDQDYRLVIYTNETDADDDDTASAFVNYAKIPTYTTQLADATDLTLRNTTLEAQDDYDRSPIYTDGNGFTAGAGPHVITLASGWDATTTSFRAYTRASDGTITPVTPSSVTSTTFTLNLTLLSTDEVFHGDDTNRPLVGIPVAGSNNRTVTATAAELNYADGPNAANKFLLLDGSAQTPFANKAAFKGALAYSTASQTIANGYSSGSVINFGAEDYDTDSFHDLSTNNSRMTIPAGVSKVRVSVYLSYTDRTGEYLFAFLKNGTIARGGGGQVLEVTSSATLSNKYNLLTSGVIEVVETDYIEIQLNQVTGSTVDVLSGSWFFLEAIE